MNLLSSVSSVVERFGTAAAIVVFIVCCPLSAAAAAHPAAFWKAIVEKDYAPPEGSNVSELTGELVDLLVSPDPQLRDEIGYSVLAAWIYQKRILGPDALRALADRLRANLAEGIGERDTDGVFRRSFSALTLAAVVARDNAGPFLSKSEVQQIEGAALRYLVEEQDVRGYDPVKGWMHSAAHTADLLKFVGRSRQLEPGDQSAILIGIGRKLTAASGVFTHGEDERFARAILSIVNRPDFNRDGFRDWVARTKPAPIRTALPARAQLDALQNVKNAFAKLEVLLSQDPQASESAQFARDALRTALKDMY